MAQSMQRLKTYIEVKTNFEGFHCYPAAPKEVAFLKDLHRHIFYVVVTVEVFNTDREIEFFILKKAVDKFISKQKWENTSSCELIATKILKFLKKKYKNREYIVSVYEDNENGAIVKCGME